MQFNLSTACDGFQYNKVIIPDTLYDIYLNPLPPVPHIFGFSFFIGILSTPFKIC